MTTRYMMQAARQRILRAPENDQGGGGGAAESGGTSDNNQGNSGQQNNNNGNQNNTGQQFDPGSFWNEPAPQTQSSPSPGGLAESGADGAGATPQNQNQGAALAGELNQSLEKMTFGQNPFTPEVMQQLADGDASGLHKAIETQQRESVRQSVTMAARVMIGLEQQIMAKVQNLVEGKFGDTESNSMLAENFPSYAKPEMQPVIRGIFNQALKLTKNDKPKAIAMAKDMLKHIGTTGGEDLGFTRTQPTTESESGMTDQATALVNDLLSRN